MKKLTWILFLALAFAFASCNNAGEKDGESDSAKSEKSSAKSADDGNIPADAIYQMKSAKIVYDYTIIGMKQKMTMYVADYGKRSVADVEMNMFGMNMKVRTITESDKVTTLDYTQKTATITKIDSSVMAERAEGVDFEEIAKQVNKEGGNAKKLGEEKILGKTCQIYEITDKTQAGTIKVWIYKNMVMKLEALSEQLMTMEAKEFEENVSLPEDLFKIPEGFTVTEM